MASTILSSGALFRSPTNSAWSRSALFPFLSASCFLAFRRVSRGPDEVQIVEIDPEAIHGIVVRQFAPDWLPFVPGASYWIPSQKRPYRLTEFIASIADSRLSDLKVRSSLTKEEKMSLAIERGWPSSAYFFEGPSAQQVKTPRKLPKPQPDDEDR